MKNPKQRRFFKTNDLFELFTLGSDGTSTESSAIFAGTGSSVKVPTKDSKKDETDAESSSKNVDNATDLDNHITLPPEKLEELRERAKKISQMLSAKFNKNSRVPGIENSIPTKEINSNKNNEKYSKKKKPKGVLFEGKRVKYLLKKDVYNEGSEAKEIISKKQDEYVLKKLFKKSSMHSALQHDIIETASNPDYAIVEKEAQKIADDAIKALKKSREQCFSASSGIPSWTGANGSINKKLQSKFGGDASSSLINAILARNKLDPKFSRENDDQDITGDLSPDVKYSTELISDLRNFVAFQATIDGEATTEEVLQFCKKKLPLQKTTIFKAILYKICDFFRRSDGTGVWKLKPDLR